MLHCMVATPYGVPCVCKPLMTKRLSVLLFYFSCSACRGRRPMVVPVPTKLSSMGEAHIGHLSG